MAGIFLAKKASICISKASLKHQPSFLHSAIGISRASISTAFKCAEGSNAGAETSGDGNEPYESQQQTLEVEEITIEATEIADTVGDTAKRTIDGAWEAAKDANRKIRETVVSDNENNKNYNENNNSSHNDEDPAVFKMQKIDGPVDTVEYRNLETHTDEVNGAD